MDIYAKAGTKVKFLDKNGNDCDREEAREHFKKGDILTVEKTEAHNWLTNVYFKECPDTFFNSVMFENL